MQNEHKSEDKAIGDTFEVSTTPVKPERKRRSSQSPQGITQPSKQVKTDLPKMAEAATAEQVEGLKTLLETIRAEQANIKQSIGDKIENAKIELNDNMNTRFQSLQDEFKMDMARITDRVDSIDKRLVELESCCITEFPVSTTCVVSGLREEPSENIQLKCEKLIKEGLGLQHTVPVRCHRMKSYTDRPGLVKIQCKTKDEKEAILGAKSQLSKESSYKRVYIRSSQTHEERLLRQNTQAILNMMPDGNKMRFTRTGRLIQKEDGWDARRTRRDQEASNKKD